MHSACCSHTHSVRAVHDPRRNKHTLCAALIQMPHIPLMTHTRKNAFYTLLSQPLRTWCTRPTHGTRHPSSATHDPRMENHTLDAALTPTGHEPYMTHVRKNALCMLLHTHRTRSTHEMCMEKCTLHVAPTPTRHKLQMTHVPKNALCMLLSHPRDTIHT